MNIMDHIQFYMQFDDLEKVVDHFDQYPLLTQKGADYKLWKGIFDMVKKKEHLTLQGLRETLALKASLNLGLSDEIKAAFPDITPHGRPLERNQKIPNPNWLVGFTVPLPTVKTVGRGQERGVFM